MIDKYDRLLKECKPDGIRYSKRSQQWIKWWIFLEGGYNDC